MQPHCCLRLLKFLIVVRILNIYCLYDVFHLPSFCIEFARRVLSCPADKKPVNGKMGSGKEDTFAVH